MFKVGEAVVLKNSSQNKVMNIQAYKDEFIRAYWSKKEYSFAHESNFRHATPEEIKLGRRIDNRVTVITPSGTQKVKGGMVAFVDMGNDSPLCLSDSRKNESQSPLSIKQDALSRMESCYIEQKKHVELLQTEVTRLNSTVERLKVENKMLHEAASTHLKNQMHFKKLYDELVEQLYPYAIDLEEPVDGDVNITSQEFINGYNRARECVHYNLLEMMESDIEYIRAQCDMLGGGGGSDESN